jgi:hypothetical protein
MKHVLVVAKKENHVLVKTQNVIADAKEKVALVTKLANAIVKIMNNIADVVDVTNKKANHIN